MSERVTAGRARDLLAEFEEYGLAVGASPEDMLRTVIAQAEEIAALREVVEAARALADHHLGTVPLPVGFTPGPRGDSLGHQRALAIRAALSRLDAQEVDRG